MLQNSTEMLKKAQKDGYAVCAFNIENMETVQAVMAAAEEARSPVILQTTPGSVAYAGLGMFAAMVKTAAGNASVPVALHLDHGDNAALCRDAVNAGYSSVMIDGSRLPLAQNIAVTSEVLAFAMPANVSVEAELGTLGGKEDGLSAKSIIYTDINDAEKFVKEAPVSALAVAIGTMHGIYKEEPKLDIGRVGEIRKKITVPLVLHGASGLKNADVRACIANGICKVNFATELRIAFTGAVAKYLRENTNTIDPKSYLKRGREAVMSTAIEKIMMCGCAGKA